MKHILTFLLVMVSALSMAINKDTTLMTIGDREISLGEFEYLYNKNNQVSTSDSSTLDDYVDLFVNFKLKVIAAEEQGYDTIPTFVKELSGYRDQLAEPYLKDQDLSEQLILEAYNRLKEEVEASHILIEVKSENPQDTLAAYQKAMEARQKILNGEDFKQVAKAYSKDPSAAQNGGYLGYFSGFQMVLPFEEAAFTTPIGNISMPFRTKFGYHIVKVHKRRPSRGEVNVSHILFLSNNKMSETVKAEKKSKAFEIYNYIKEGEATFEDMAETYSEDHGTSSRGGNLGYIKAGQTIGPFEDVAFNLSKGEVSAPVKTRFGWHIVRLEDKRSIPTFDEKKEDIKRRLARDERGQKPEKVFIERLHKEYNYTLDEESLNSLLAKTNGMEVDSTYEAMIYTLQDTLVTYGDVVKTQGDYAKYCLAKEPNKILSESHLGAFEKENLMAYEKSRLEIKYEDFRYLMNEYHDGLLLFEISNDLVWGKASEDIKGLEKFYKRNKKNYIFKDSCQQADLMFFRDSTVYAIYQNLKDSMELQAIKDSLNQGVIVFKTSEGYYKVGDDAVVDALAFGKTDDGIYNGFKVINIEGQRYEAGDIKPLDATRGACISDYQNYLEKRWIKKLRRKHRIKVNKDILNQLQ